MAGCARLVEYIWPMEVKFWPGPASNLLSRRIRSVTLGFRKAIIPSGATAPTLNPDGDRMSGVVTLVLGFSSTKPDLFGSTLNSIPVDEMVPIALTVS